MNHLIVESSDGVTLVAGGPVTRRDLMVAIRRAPRVVAADGGADQALSAGVVPEAVTGDMDSISAGARAALGAARIFAVSEQETTDFDKALRQIGAPFVLGLGCLGGRVDHELAVLNSLVRHAARPCLLIGRHDVVFHAPGVLDLDLQAGDRVSLFPLRAVQGESAGLRWPLGGIGFAPGGGAIGTSNEVTGNGGAGGSRSAGAVSLRFDGPGMLVILPRARLDAAIRALVPGWRPPRGWLAPPRVPGG